MDQPTVQKKAVKRHETVQNKSPWFWITDTKGYKSVSLTFATVSFAVTSVAYVVSIFEKVGDVSFRQFDSTACGAYFGTIMALYWGRKWTEAKYQKGDTSVNQ